MSTNRSEPADSELISLALQMRANYIETGNVAMSRADVELQLSRMPNKSSTDAVRIRQLQGMCRPLGDEQATLVLRLRDLAQQQRNAETDRTHEAPMRPRGA